MTLLEITNRAETRPLIEQFAIEDRDLPPTVMLYVSLKGVAGLILNICLLFFITLAGWEVVDGSKRRRVMKFVTEPKTEPNTDEPSKVLWNKRLALKRCFDKARKPLIFMCSSQIWLSFLKRLQIVRKETRVGENLFQVGAPYQNWIQRTWNGVTLQKYFNYLLEWKMFLLVNLW